MQAMGSVRVPESVKLATIWVVWTFLSLSFLGWSLHVILASVGRVNEMPAWVQAIGSIGAIVAAIWVVSAQSRHQIELLKKQEAEALKKVVAIARYANNVNQVAIEVLLESNSAHEDIELALLGLRRAEALLIELPFHLIPESEASIGWIELRFVTTELRMLVDRLLRDPSFDSSEAEKGRGLSRFSSEAVARIRQASSDHLPALRDPL
ncbi:hypothetical protein MID92_019160 [Pseudomonas aeruginosa]|jgi:hypothetical protein|nr:hypothetical protein [Pseudomonas aeruginosa]